MSFWKPLRQGIKAIERRELEEALALFTRIIERAPDFAEGRPSQNPKSRIESGGA